MRPPWLQPRIPTRAGSTLSRVATAQSRAEVDKLIESIEIELDRAKRKKLWHRLQVIYATELPVIPLYFRAEPYILPKWLTGLEPTGHQDPSPLWVENWGIKP